MLLDLTVTLIIFTDICVDDGNMNAYGPAHLIQELSD